jgi:hypothetical protein
MRFHNLLYIFIINCVYYIALSALHIIKIYMYMNDIWHIQIYFPNIFIYNSSLAYNKFDGRFILRFSLTK